MRKIERSKIDKGRKATVTRWSPAGNFSILEVTGERRRTFLGLFAWTKRETVYTNREVDALHLFDSFLATGKFRRLPGEHRCTIERRGSGVLARCNCEDWYLFMPCENNERRLWAMERGLREHRAHADRHK